MTRFVSLSEELAVKLEHARAEWEAQKVQVLIEDDGVPPGHEVALKLEDLEKYLESLEVPTKVIIDLDVYKVKLRKKVPYDRYKEILSGLNSLSRARWDKKARAILVERTKEMEEQLEVEEIVITPKEEAREKARRVVLKEVESLAQGGLIVKVRNRIDAWVRR